MNSKVDIVIDYLTFTVKFCLNPDELIESILGMDTDLFEVTKGVNFYSSAKYYDNIRVCYDGNGRNDQNMGVCFIMSGQGLRTYENHTNQSALIILHAISNNPNISISRIDIACDDKSNILDINTIWEYAKAKNYRTRLSSKSFYESFKGDISEKSLYWGATKSECRICIYDKAKEQYDPDRHPKHYSSHWIRVELRIKGFYAKQVLALLVHSDNIGDTVSGIINDKFTFINRDNENITRCSVPVWWENFIGAVEDVTLLTKPKNQHYIETHLDWLRHSVSRTIAKVYVAIGDVEFDNKIIQYGKEKLTDSDKKQIRDYKKSAKEKRVKTEIEGMDNEQ